MRKRIAGTFVVGAIVILGASRGYAQGVGGGGLTHTDVTLRMPPTMPGEDPALMGAVGARDAPVCVTLDPHGPTWMKDLWWSGGTVPPGGAIILTEDLVVGGEQSWTGWHQRIMTDSFQWWGISATVVPGDVPLPGLVRDFAPPGDPPGTGLSISFAPLAPGAQIRIWEMFKYTGPSPLTLTGPITIEQYPTPEPASVALIGAGGFALMRRRR